MMNHSRNKRKMKNYEKELIKDKFLNRKFQTWIRDNRSYSKSYIECITYLRKL